MVRVAQETALWGRLEERCQGPAFFRSGISPAWGRSKKEEFILPGTETVWVSVLQRRWTDVHTVVHQEPDLQGNEQQKQYRHHQGGKVEDGIKEAPQLLQTCTLLQRETNHTLCPWRSELHSPLHIRGNWGTFELSENVPLTTLRSTSTGSIWNELECPRKHSHVNRWRAQSGENLSNMVVNVNTFLTHQLVKLERCQLLADWLSCEPIPMATEPFHLAFSLRDWDD